MSLQSTDKRCELPHECFDVRCWINIDGEHLTAALRTNYSCDLDQRTGNWRMCENYYGGPSKVQSRPCIRLSAYRRLPSYLARVCHRDRHRNERPHRGGSCQVLLDR